MSRPSKLMARRQREARRRRDRVEPIRDISHSYAVSHSTISRLAV